MGKWAAVILRAESLNVIQLHHYPVLHLWTLETFGAILVVTMIGEGEGYNVIWTHRR